MNSNDEVIKKREIVEIIEYEIGKLNAEHISDDNVLAQAGKNLAIAVLGATSDFINAYPAIDAVEVVRCKDCIHRHESEFCECRDADAFCSDGERRETADERKARQCYCYHKRDPRRTR